MYKFQDIYLAQVLRELAPNKADILAEADCVNISASGSILCREIRVPVSAEAILLHDRNLGQLIVNVKVTGGEYKLSHRAVADSRRMTLKGGSKQELRESYKDAAAYIDHIIVEMHRDIMEFLAFNLRKEEAALDGRVINDA